jgi:hypothetical protein
VEPGLVFRLAAHTGAASGAPAALPGRSGYACVRGAGAQSMGSLRSAARYLLSDMVDERHPHQERDLSEQRPSIREKIRNLDRTKKRPTPE